MMDVSLIIMFIQQQYFGNVTTKHLLNHDWINVDTNIKQKMILSCAMECMYFEMKMLSMYRVVSGIES